MYFMRRAGRVQGYICRAFSPYLHNQVSLYIKNVGRNIFPHEFLRNDESIADYFERQCTVQGI